MEEIFKDIEERMQKSIDNLKTELMKLRTGRATPSILEGIRVEYYGTKTPINQIAGIAIPEPRLIVIQPWDKSALPEIERAIRNSDLGLNPQNDGNLIRIPIPPLSEERRRDLVKLARKFAEDTRIAIRNIRRDGIEKLRHLEREKEISEDDKKTAEDNIQKITDRNIEEVNDIISKKEKEILEE